MHKERVGSRGAVAKSRIEVVDAVLAKGHCAGSYSETLLNQRKSDLLDSTARERSVRVMSALLFRGIPYGSEFKDNRHGQIGRVEVKKRAPRFVAASPPRSYIPGQERPASSSSSRGESGRGIFLLLLETHASRKMLWPLTGPFINKALPYRIFHLFTTVTNEPVRSLVSSDSFLYPCPVALTLYSARFSKFYFYVNSSFSLDRWYNNRNSFAGRNLPDKKFMAESTRWIFGW